MDASYKIQRGIHVHLIQFFMCPEFWVHINRERRMQKAVLDIKKRYGKNAILKGMNLEEGATTMNRNGQIGGHRA